MIRIMNPDGMPLVRLEDVEFRYLSKVVVSGITLEIPFGKVVALFGPNGCGKSTILRIISGRLKPFSGSAQIPATGAAGFVFQNYRDSLFPWRTALGNVRFPLECRGIKGENAQASAQRALAIVGAVDLSDAYPYRLSGGQAQRIAIARAVASSPQLVLLDEPSSALDIVARRELWIALERVIAGSSAGYLLVTHDLDEAIMLADRVIVMSPGPGRIIGEIDVDLPRPRGPAIIADPRFLELRSKLAATFEATLAERTS